MNLFLMIKTQSAKKNNHKPFEIHFGRHETIYSSYILLFECMSIPNDEKIKS